MNSDYINKLSQEIHKHNVDVGWWEGNICIYEKLQLVSTEVAEATEGARKQLKDDKLPHYTMEGVELADTLIRTLDLGGRLDLEYNPLGLEFPFVKQDSSVGKLHLAINVQVVDFAKAITLNKSNEVLSDYYSALIESILAVAKIREHNIALMMKEKLEFNKIRPDHKKENRAKENGKKF